MKTRIKGRIQCPHCKKEFSTNERNGHIKEIQKCPNCNQEFIVKQKTKNDISCEKTSTGNSEECNWEEHGEPRKTILSSLKPRTDKSMLASILLIMVVIIGLFSLIFPTAFLQTPLDVISTTGVTGEITFHIQDQNSNNLEDMYIWISPSFINSTNITGSATLTNIKLEKK